MLIFPLKKQWYEKIKSGEKTIEYREVKDYWTKHIVKEISCFKLRFSNDPCIKCEGYFTKRREYGDSTTYHSQNIYNGAAEEFNEKSYNKYTTAFTSKELAQQICDKINKNNGVPDNLEIEK